MPDQPSNWARVIEFITAYGLAFQGGLMAFIVAWLRITYDGEEKCWKAKLLDATLCALISAPVGFTLLELGMSTTFTIPVCSFIGLLGVDWIRGTVSNYFDRKKKH